MININVYIVYQLHAGLKIAIAHSLNASKILWIYYYAVSFAHKASDFHKSLHICKPVSVLCFQHGT